MPNGHKGHYDKCVGAHCACEVIRYWRVLAIIGATFALERAGGAYSGSLALLADAWHVGLDGLAVFLTILVAYVVRRGGPEVTVRKLGGLASAALLAVAAGSVLGEACQHIARPEPVKGLAMLLVAGLGAIGNWWQHRVLEGAADEHKHLNHQSLVLHVRSDLLQSIAVVIGGVLVWLTGKVAIDTWISLGVGVALAWWAVSLGRASLRSGAQAHDHAHDD